MFLVTNIPPFTVQVPQITIDGNLPQPQKGVIRVRCLPDGTLKYDKVTATADSTGDTSALSLEADSVWGSEEERVAAQFDEPSINNQAENLAGKYFTHVPSRFLISGLGNQRVFARRSSGWDRFRGYLVSVGSHTDTVVDHFGEPDSIIPHLRRMCEQFRSSSWAHVLSRPPFDMPPEKAHAFAVALEKDICKGTYGYIIPAKVRHWFNCLANLLRWRSRDPKSKKSRSLSSVIF